MTSKDKPTGKPRRRGKGWRKNAKSKNGKDNAKPSNDSTKTGSCKSLGTHVFDYGPKNAADQMATTWEQIVIHVGTNMGEDISNELRNRKETIIPKPEIPPDVVARYEAEVQRKARQLERTRAGNVTALVAIQAALVTEDDNVKLADLAIKEAELENRIADIQHLIDNPPAIELTGQDRTEFEGRWKTYTSRVAKLIEHRGQAFSLILGQCTQVLKDKMKHDSEYTVAMDNHSPFDLKHLITKKILSQSDDQYPYTANYL